jgi:hypothetical protein
MDFFEKTRFFAVLKSGSRELAQHVDQSGWLEESDPAGVVL